MYLIRDRVSEDWADDATLEGAKRSAEEHGLKDYYIVRNHQEVVFDSREPVT